MQANIRNMEDAQRIAELENEVSEYKLKVRKTFKKIRRWTDAGSMCSLGHGVEILGNK